MAHALRYLISVFFARGCAFVALAGSLAAQSPRAAEQQVRFTVFSARPIPDLTFTPRMAAVPQKVVFYPTARSPRYEYRGAMPLRFVDATTKAVVAEATVPLEIRDVLLLFTPIEPAPATGLRYQISVLDDSALRQAGGGLAIINFSGLELAGTIGKTEVTLKAGLNPALPVGRSAKITLRTLAKGRSYQSYADTLQLKAGERALLILFPPFYKGSLEVQSRMLIDEPPGTNAPAAAGAR